MKIVAYSFSVKSTNHFSSEQSVAFDLIAKCQKSVASMSRVLRSSIGSWIRKAAFYMPFNTTTGRVFKMVIVTFYKKNLNPKTNSV